MTSFRPGSAAVPVTAKFSKEFYDELVDWFNKADATYRTDLREVNELNFAGFDAKVEQRFAEQDARWERRFTEHDAKWERRFSQQDAKWERRFAQMDAKWEQRFAQLDAKLELRFAEQDSRWERRVARLQIRLIRCMLGLWIASFGATMTLLKLWVG